MNNTDDTYLELTIVEGKDNAAGLVSVLQLTDEDCFERIAFEESYNADSQDVYALSVVVNGKVTVDRERIKSEDHLNRLVSKYLKQLRVK